MTKQLVHHLALIPDGNRRWAKKHAIEAQKRIYEKGGDTTMDVIEAAFREEVQFVTFWGSSYANLAARSKGLVTAFEEMVAKKFRVIKKHPLIHEKHVRVEVLGEWRELLKPKTCETIQEAIDATEQYSDRLLTILLGYDGRRERGDAVMSLLADAQENTTEVPEDVLAADQLLRQYAWTGHLPDVDLVVRTGAWEDPHNSAGFLSLITSESQFAFPQVLWPDFTPELLAAELDAFGDRERRMGR